MNQYDIPNGIRLVHKNWALKITFTDNIVFAVNLKIAGRVIEVLPNTSGKAVLQTSFEKTKYINMDTKDTT